MVNFCPAIREVPNAPCGVESVFNFPFVIQKHGFVPNAPCGVESQLRIIWRLKSFLPFLMHRVELKGQSLQACGGVASLGS